jgi:prefoldin subunit 5
VISSLTCITISEGRKMKGWINMINKQIEAIRKEVEKIETLAKEGKITKDNYEFYKTKMTHLKGRFEELTFSIR